MKVLIRADSSVELGSGHIMRCLTLAEELNQQGAELSFICQDLAGNLAALIEQKGFQVQLMPAMKSFDAEQDALRSLTILESLGNCDWLIVDHYSIAENWESQMRPYVKKILVIDDLADRKHDCDVLLDQNYNTNTNRYENLIPSSSQQLLGPKYALLRTEFSEAREQLKQRNGNIKNILVSFGGSDATNETKKTIVALKQLEFDIEADVVVGSSYPYLESLKETLSSTENMRLHVQVSNMAQLMLNADIAIGSGGSTSWERACLGLPSIVIATADNQLAIAETLALEGYQLYLGKAENVNGDAINQAVQSLENRFLYQMLVSQSQELCDAKGVQRVAKVILEPVLIVRKALMSDCEPVFEWRNAPDIRQASLNADPIDFGEHQAWFKRSLELQDRHLLIAQLGHSACGVLRYDLDRKLKCAEISIYLAPEYLSQGLGNALLKAGEYWLKTNEASISIIKAVVKVSNPRSRRLFEKNGYQEEHIVFSKALS